MNEREAILRIANLLNISSDCLYADACLFQDMLFSIDGYSASESLLPWMNLEDWGWKAVIAAFSDVIASGGTPLLALYSVGVMTAEEGLSVARGVKEASEWLGVKVLGGDLNRCRSDRWIDVTAIGRKSRNWLRWNSARPGLKVVQVGYIGFGAIAYLLLKGLVSAEEIPKELIKYTKRPTPPMKELAEALKRYDAEAAIDNSDGWAWSLKTISLASKVRIEIQEILVPDEMIEILKLAEGKGVKTLKLLLNSAEDYNYAVLARDSEAEGIVDFLEKKGVPADIVGESVKGEGVRFSGKEVEIIGWDSFEQ
jgi:thiamine-monophosphate kinase